jgi:fibronectin type 3 domain-containing protein
MYCYSVTSTDSSGNESAKSYTVCGTTEAPPVPAYVDLLISSPQLSSSGASPVTLTALVKDSQHRAMAGEKVVFTASSGILTDVMDSTDANGMATAKLGTGGEPTDRKIDVTVTAGNKSGANQVAVTGTTISIDPPSFSLLFNDPDGKGIVVSLKDSAGGAIAGKTVSIVSASGKSSFTPAGHYTTDNSGQVRVTVKNATDLVGDTLTASAIGVASESKLTINTAKLTIVTPTADEEISISLLPLREFKVVYTEGGVAVAAKTIYFTTTRGVLSASNVATDGSGVATVTVSSNNSGPAVLNAYTTGTPQASVQRSIVFVAQDAKKMDVSASPANINTNAVGQTSEQSVIKAIVRDDKDNLVKGKTVNFTIAQDASGGKLSSGSAVTDMYGTATTSYIAGGNTGGLNNVVIRATVQDAPAVTKTATLTVGGQALFISLATGSGIAKVEPNMYRKDYLALVTDAAGSPVPNAVVTATVVPRYYMKGYYYVFGDVWLQRRTIVASTATNPIVPACGNEDGITQDPLYDYNGVLDTGEDQNANSRLDPGNVASVSATVTDSTGHSTVSLTYARDYATWVNVKLDVRANLSGSTSSASQTFDLPGLGSDYTDIKVSPPGNPSPFGSNATCYAALTVLTVSDTKISLSWEPSAYASSYDIWRDPNDGVTAATKISTTTKTSYDDTVAAGSTYCYEIKLPDGTRLAAYGNRVCASSTPAAPTVYSVANKDPLDATNYTKAISSSQIQVSWKNTGATSYRIYKDGVRLQESVSTQIVSGALAANTQYCYQVTSLDAAGSESAKSDAVCVTTQPVVPATPTNLTAAGAAGPKVTLTWTNNGAALYRIYRDGVLMLSATGTPVDDTGVAAKTGYCYTISAVDASGNESVQSTPQCTATP